MKNLSVSTKLLMVAVLFGLAILIAVSALSWKLYSVRVAPDTEELYGNQILAPLYEVRANVVQRRSSYLTGIRPTVEADKQLAEIGNLSAKYDGWLQTSGAWSKTSGDVSAINSRESADNALRSLLSFSDHVGDSSTLILDPDLDTYWLMSAIVVTMPKLIDQIGQLNDALVQDQRQPSPEHREQVLIAQAGVDFYMAALKQCLENAETYAREAGHLSVSRDGLRQAHASLVQAVDSMKQDVLKIGDVNAHYQSAIGQSLAVYHSLISVFDQLDQNRIALNWRIIIGVILFSALGFILVTGLAFYISRDIVSQLATAVSAASEFGSGDLRRDVKSDRRDELGQLLNALEKMRASLREQILQLRGASDMNQATAQTIQSSASQVAASSAEMATSIAEVSTTVEEVRQTALLSEQKAKTMAQTAQEAALVSAQGTQATGATQQEMEQVRSTMDSIAESIMQLSNQSQAISNIITSVNDLAEQSNVLAVNASIEAAKAGEFGRGFAVVAQEVKSLADESKQATNQVRAILQEIERSTAAAVLVAEQGSRATQSALKQATEAGEAIRVLGTRVVQAAQAAAQISMSSQQQLQGMEQVVEAMVGIKESSAQMVPSMSQLSTSADKLATQANNLRNSAVNFRLE